jgi:hypothetical protein
MITTRPGLGRHKAEEGAQDKLLMAPECALLEFRVMAVGGTMEGNKGH